MTDKPTHPADPNDASEQALADLISQLADQVARGINLDLLTVCREHPQFATDLRDLWGTVVVANVAATEYKTDLDSTIVFQSLQGIDLPCEFGNYTLEQELGRGGMGIVYRATRHRDGQPVAVKMILKGDFASLDDRRRFDAEALAASKLSHPNIVPIYEIGEQGGRAFFCMKLIEGESLSERLQRGPIQSREAARIMGQISHAISHAHGQGILHRDLKPSNLLIDPEGDAFVADFGLAKHSQDQISLTRSGAVLGTPSYMSPEQAAGIRGQVGPSSDIYSLGAILYHMLTGRPPFLGASPIDTVMMVLEQDPISPRVLNRQTDRSLEMIAMRCLQKPQDLRYASAQDLAKDFEAFLNDETVSARIGRIGQMVENVFRETHHAAVLDNWGLIWMWHGVVLFFASLATAVLSWSGVTGRFNYWLLWTAGLGAWAIVFWKIRHRMGPVMFVERQIAHVWAASMMAVMLLFPLEYVLELPVLSLSPVLGALTGMVFLIKAGILSGSFYIPAFVMFATSCAMALYPPGAMLIFGIASASCFFLSGLKYYRRKRSRLDSELDLAGRGGN